VSAPNLFSDVSLEANGRPTESAHSLNLEFGLFDPFFICERRWLGEAIVPPAGFDLDAYIASGALGFFPKQSIQLVAIFSAEVAAHLYETPLAEGQAMTALPDGRIQLEATLPETLQLRWWLQGFGDAVEVVQPSALRADIAAGVRRLLERYEG